MRLHPSGWKKGLPANRQPLHKGASGMSTQSQPLNGGGSPAGVSYLADS
jgi:hypothetical protein